MKSINLTYLPDELVSKGKSYIKDYSFREHSKMTPNHITVMVLSIPQKDLGLAPRPHVFIEVKTVLDKILSPVSAKYGAKMGRASVGERPTDGTTIFDCYVPMDNEGYELKASVYWGLGTRLRVSYTKDLNFIHFYRELIAA